MPLFWKLGRDLYATEIGYKPRYFVGVLPKLKVLSNQFCHSNHPEIQKTNVSAIVNDRLKDEIQIFNK